MGLPVNCTLRFSVLGPIGSGPNIAQYDDDGNPALGQTITTITASVSRKALPQATQDGGANLDGQTVIFAGRSAVPKIVDMSELPRDARAEITDPVTGQVLTGRAIFGLPTQSKFRAVTNAMGTKLEFEFLESEGR